MHLTRRAPPPRWDRRHRRRRTAAGSTMGGRGDGGQVAPAWCGGVPVRAERCCCALAFILNPSAALAGYIVLGALMRGDFYVVTKGGVRFDVSFTPYQQSWQLAGSKHNFFCARPRARKQLLQHDTLEYCIQLWLSFLRCFLSYMISFDHGTKPYQVKNKQTRSRDEAFSPLQLP